MPVKKQSPTQSEEVNRVGHLISLLERMIRKEVSDALASLNLTLQQYAALMILNNETDISNAKLAKRSFMTPQSANEMVNALEAKQFIRRKPDTNHGRIVHILITAKGKRILHKADAEAMRVERRMLETLAPNAKLAFRNQLIHCIAALQQSAATEYLLSSTPKV